MISHSVACCCFQSKENFGPSDYEAPVLKFLKRHLHLAASDAQGLSCLAMAVGNAAVVLAVVARPDFNEQASGFAGQALPRLTVGDATM